MTKVLLVDDDAKTRDVLKRRLIVEGYQVVEAADAESALEEYRLWNRLRAFVRLVMSPS